VLSGSPSSETMSSSEITLIDKLNTKSPIGNTLGLFLIQMGGQRTLLNCNVSDATRRFRLRPAV